MAAFSSTDAAFSGFRVVRQHIAAVGVWAVVQFIFSLALSLLLFSVAGDAASAMQAAAAASPGDVAARLAVLCHLAPIYAVMIPTILVFYAIALATMSRVVLRPEQSGFAYLRLGIDELRQGLLILALMALGFVFEIAAIILIFIVLLLLSLAAKAAVAAAAVVLFLLLFCAFVFIAVRLSLASPATFASGRIGIAASWRLTRGRFWPMFGAYLLTFALTVVVFVLGEIVVVAVTAVGGGGLNAIAALTHPHIASLADLVSPVRLLAGAVGAILGVLMLPLSLTPPAYIYRALSLGA